MKYPPLKSKDALYPPPRLYPPTSTTRRCAQLVSFLPLPNSLSPRLPGHLPQERIVHDLLQCDIALGSRLVLRLFEKILQIRFADRTIIRHRLKHDFVSLVGGIGIQREFFRDKLRHSLFVFSHRPQGSEKASEHFLELFRIFLGLVFRARKARERL